MNQPLTKTFFHADFHQPLAAIAHLFGLDCGAGDLFL